MSARAGTRRTLAIAAAALAILPVATPMAGLAVNTATIIVVLSIAALGLNMMVGRTGLVSFGHGAWFGIGAYAAAQAQRQLLPDQIVLPLLCGMAFVAVLSLGVGALILRRRGVYFALMTLAFSALAYSIAFRWTAVTGGEDGLGGIERGALGPIDLADNHAYYVFVALVGFAVLWLLLRVEASPFGHALAAIRENQLRAGFQGFAVRRYRLGVFVLSSTITALAGGLSAFQHYIATAEAASVELSGELLAMVVIGGMRGHILGPALGVVFYIVFREVFSIWTSDWLLYFGLVFVGFVIFSPGGLIGVWERLRRLRRAAPKEEAAMSRRRIREGLPLPDFLRGETGDGPALEAAGLSLSFGGVKAVSGASLTVAPGRIHALIGPNGAGKTTLFNIVSGRFPPDEGAVRLRGRDVTGLGADRIAQAGLGRSFQITSLFEGLTIRENIRLSAQAKDPGRFDFLRAAASFAEVERRTDETLRFLGLEGIEETRAGDLSYGGQRLVDLGIALAGAPRVLLLDEPLAGLAAAERERVSRLIVAAAETIPVLIVEHDIDRVLGFSHEVTVMNEGAVLLTAPPSSIRGDRRVQEIYTGTGVPVVTGRRAAGAAKGEIVLSVEGLDAFYGKSHVLHSARLEARAGEIVALLGRNGAGKSTFLRAISGLVPARSGAVRLDGREIGALDAPEIARLGIGYVPQGRGVFSGMSVADNLALGRLARPAEGEGVSWSEAEIFEMFPRLRERLRTHADHLSGGEQQMLAVARALSGNVRLLLLDEPFEGLAPAVVEELFAVFDRLRARLPIVIVEHNLDLVLALADRVFALENGSVFHEGPAAELLCDLDRRKEILWL